MIRKSDVKFFKKKKNLNQTDVLIIFAMMFIVMVYLWGKKQPGFIKY